MWGHILNGYMEDNKLWRLLIVAFCIAVCAFFPRRFKAGRNVPLFIAYYVLSVAASFVVRYLLDMISYAAGENIYVMLVNEFLYLFIVFMGAMALCGKMRSFRQSVACLSFVAANSVTGSLFALYEYSYKANYTHNIFIRTLWGRGAV